MSLAIGAALAALMLAIALSDWRSYRVPDRLTGLALALRVFDIIVAPQGSRVDALLNAGLRAACVAAMFYLFRAGYGRWRGREGLGLGDVKLGAVAGAWVDWQALPYVVEAAALVGLALAFGRGLGDRRALRADTKLPFAVGFAPAIFLGWSLGGLV